MSQPNSVPRLGRPNKKDAWKAHHLIPRAPQAFEGRSTPQNSSKKNSHHKQTKRTLDIEPHLKIYKSNINKTFEAIQTNAIKHLQHIILTKTQIENKHAPPKRHPIILNTKVYFTHGT